MAYYPEWLDPPGCLLPEYQEHAWAWVDQIDTDEEKELLEDHYDD